MLDIKNLTKVYKTTSKKAVDDLSLSFNNGEIVGFIGHNGAGKSTTIKAIMGLINVDNDVIFIKGKDVNKNRIFANKQLSYVCDVMDGNDGLIGVEYLNFIADMFDVSKEDRDARIKTYSEIFEMGQSIYAPIKTYSHGLKQKLNIIASLVRDFNIWILDEPMSGLDPNAVFWLKKIMIEMKKAGKLVIFSSHNLDIVEKLCDRVILIKKGKLVYDVDIEKLNEIKKDRSLERFYLDVMGEENA